MKHPETPQRLPVQNDHARARKRGMRIRTQIRAGGGNDDNVFVTHGGG
jgi:hypothetical protein